MKKKRMKYAKIYPIMTYIFLDNEVGIKAAVP
jgi:hypothetical protein